MYHLQTKGPHEELQVRHCMMDLRVECWYASIRLRAILIAKRNDGRESAVDIRMLNH